MSNVITEQPFNSLYPDYMHTEMQPAAHAIALNIKLLLQIHFYLTRGEIYLTLEYYSENVWEKARKKNLAQINNM